MPRHVWLDAPGTLRAGIVRGVVRSRIVAARAAFVVRDVGALTSGISKALSRAGK